MDDAGPARKRRKGGIQQRQSQAEASKTSISALHDLLMTYLAQGLMSAAVCHAIATAAVADMGLSREGTVFPDLEKLAKIKHGKNLQKSIDGLLAKQADLPTPKEFDIPLAGQVPGQPTSLLLLPHEMMAHMFSNGTGWVTSVLPDPSRLAAFWDCFRKHPCMEGHPLLSHPQYRNRCIPLAMHGDEVPVLGVGKIWCRSALAFSWNSLMATFAGRSVQDTNLYIWGCFEKFIVGDDEDAPGTMATYAPGSAEAAKAGTLLCGGYFGALVQLAGDLDYYAKWLQVPKWNNHEKPCCLCRASFKGPLSWMDNRESSPWQSAGLKPSNWKTHWDSACALFQLPGFNGLCLSMDYMHCMFLGWLQYAYGSVLSLVFSDCLEGTEAERLKHIDSFIKNYQREHGTRYKFKQKLLKLTMIQPKKGFPKIRGRASDVQSLDTALLAFFQQEMDEENYQHKQILLFLRLNCRLSEKLDTFSPRHGYLALPEQEARQALLCGLQMAQLHISLQQHYKAAGRHLFNLTSKTHFALHSLSLSGCIHPAMVWCFKGESTMHRVQTLWKSCLPGVKHWQVARKAALKERHLLWLRGKVG
ncbi:unnamed protein product [Symbiodinium natans]|uniref:Uncharacterized protein n=1 Tax=Symbiodinium natans TaxID=878477 RepID=A0A812L8G5_9DINO|nr:unnamed protein product [Symbiodinium natans]CAE7419885.1 unnamed protein product [Symbiodinium natans]